MYDKLIETKHYYMYLCIDVKTNKPLHWAIDTDVFTATGRRVQSAKLDKEYAHSGLYRYETLVIGMFHGDIVSVESLNFK